MMSEVIIREVKTKAELKKFVDVPNRMYRNVKEFVPAIFEDDLEDWDKKKNPAFDYCEARAFLAIRDGKIVGRIGAILSHRSNEVWGTNRMRFTQVDFIDDPDVSDALFQTVENWAREKGCDEVHGPLGFSDMNREGMLVDGFDRQSMFITYYNYPYYNDHLTRLGYQKDTDWVEYRISVPGPEEEYFQKMHRLAEDCKNRYGYHVADLRNRSDINKYAVDALRLVNAAYAKLYSVVELDNKMIKKIVNSFLSLMNPDYCAFILNKEGELKAMAVCAPSLARPLKKSHGRLFPFGWAGVLRALKKNDTLDMFLIAVSPELQGSGLNCLAVDHILKGCFKNGIRFAETGPMLEWNRNIRGQWKDLHAEPCKRRRCYIKKIDPVSDSEPTTSCRC